MTTTFLVYLPLVGWTSIYSGLDGFIFQEFLHSDGFHSHPPSVLHFETWSVASKNISRARKFVQTELQRIPDDAGLRF